MAKDSIFSNVLWKLSERMGAQLVSTIVSIILARLLYPEDYGIIAIVTIIITICNVFVSAGFGNSLIQKKEIDELDYSSGFFSSLAISIAIYGAVFAIAPLIAKIYADVRLIAVIRVMGLRIPIGSINSFQQAYLSRKMLFKKFFLATLIGTIVSAGIGIYMAYAGAGYWALVAQYMASSIINTIVLAIVIKWTPKLIFSFKRTLGLLSFGWKVLCTSLLDTLFNELRGILISLKYSSTDLAFYTKGNSYPGLITTNVNVSISNVMFAAMSNIQEDRVAIKSLMKKSIQISIFFIAPLLLGLSCVADDFVRILLTEKWMECVPFIRIACIYSLFYPIHTINFQALNAVGDSGKVLKLEVIKKLINVVVLFVTVPFGVITIAYGGLAVSLISTFINAYYSKREFNYSIVRQLIDILPTILCSVIMYVFVFFVGFIIPIDGLLGMIMKILLGAVVYIVMSIIFRLEGVKFVFKKIFHKEI